jgi:endonuclease YncB( thermonuclease family)
MQLIKLIPLSIILSTITLSADVGILSKIVDGDTLYFQSNNEIIKCRMQFIDTPESSNNNKNKKDVKNCRNTTEDDLKSAGASATRAAKRLMEIGRQYTYTTSGKDRYQRSLCTVELNNKTFNETMVETGYAIPYRQYMNKTQLSHYENLLNTAKQNNAGVWKDFKNVFECLNNS